jgi:hypothetical protein
MNERIRPAVIVDVDGTLCNVTDIRHHVTQHPKNFDAFHREAAECPPNMPVIHLCDAWHLRGVTVVVVTARKYQWLNSTTAWLDRWMPCPYEGPFMRGDLDNRPDTEVKAQIHKILTDDHGFDVIACIDDNPAIVALWESMGIPTTVVPGWGRAG